MELDAGRFVEALAIAAIDLGVPPERLMAALDAVGVLGLAKVGLVAREALIYSAPAAPVWHTADHGASLQLSTAIEQRERKKKVAPEICGKAVETAEPSVAAAPVAAEIGPVEKSRRCRGKTVDGRPVNFRWPKRTPAKEWTIWVVDQDAVNVPPHRTFLDPSNADWSGLVAMYGKLFRGERFLNIVGEASVLLWRAEGLVTYLRCRKFLREYLAREAKAFEARVGRYASVTKAAPPKVEKPSTVEKFKVSLDEPPFCPKCGGVGSIVANTSDGMVLAVCEPCSQENERRANEAQ